MGQGLGFRSTLFHNLVIALSGFSSEVALLPPEFSQQWRYDDALGDVSVCHSGCIYLGTSDSKIYAHHRTRISCVLVNFALANKSCRIHKKMHPSENYGNDAPVVDDSHDQSARRIRRQRNPWNLGTKIIIYR